MQQKDGFSLHIYSFSLCLFIGKLRPLILREIKDHLLLILVCFGFVVLILGIMGRFTLLFLLASGKVELSIAYVFVSVVNFLGLEFPFQNFL